MSKVFCIFCIFSYVGLMSTYKSFSLYSILCIILPLISLISVLISVLLVEGIRSKYNRLILSEIMHGVLLHCVVLAIVLLISRITIWFLLSSSHLCMVTWGLVVISTVWVVTGSAVVGGVCFVWHWLWVEMRFCKVLNIYIYKNNKFVNIAANMHKLSKHSHFYFC